jgi:hypothetical protein
MRIADLIEYVNTLVPYTYFAYSFPPTAPDAAAAVLIGAGMATDELSVTKPSVQLLVRGNIQDLESAETIAFELFDALKYKRDFLVGDASIVELYSTQSAPLYTGFDENERHLFSLNFMATIRP